MRTTVLLLVAGLVVAAGVLPAVGPSDRAFAQEEGTVVGRPDLGLSATENRVGPGERAVFEVFVTNSADLDRGGPGEFEERVTTARNVRLDVREDRLPEELAGELRVESGEAFAGSVPEGVSGPFGFTFELSGSVPPGTYEIPVEVSYDYTNFVRYGPNRAPEYGDSSRSQTLYFTVVVEDRPRFDVRAQNLTRFPAGDTATYRLELTNEGTAPATDAQVRLSVANSSVFFGGPDDPQQRTGFRFERIDPGETKTVAVTVGASEDTAPGTYLADASVVYANPNGVQERSEPLTFGVAVGSEQTFAVRGVYSTLRVGDTGVVSGRLVNTGETNVSDAVLLVGGDDSTFRPRATEVAVGDLAAGESADFSFRVDTANDTDAGPRRIPVRVQYRNAEGDRRTSDPIDVPVAVAREQTFDVSATASGLVPGDRGTVSGTVVNTGETNVSNAVVVLGTRNSGLRPAEREVAVGDLSPNESAAFSYEVAVPNESSPGIRPVSIRVRYRNADGEVRYSDSFDAAVSVAGERTFALDNVSADLQVGRSGTISGSVVNTADALVSNAVLVLRTNDPSLDVRETEYALGRLEPNESARFEYTLDVSNESEPAPRQVTFRVRYRNSDGDPRASDALDARVAVAPERDEFRVEPGNATVPVGSAEVVEVRVTNAANQTLRDVEAKLVASDPLFSDDDEAFVSRLAAGESATLKFRVAAADGAIPKAYPVSVDFTYEDARGDAVRSDAYRVPVEVVERRGRTLPFPADATLLAVVGLGALVVALGALVLWKYGAIARLRR